MVTAASLKTALRHKNSKSKDTARESFSGREIVQGCVVRVRDCIPVMGSGFCDIQQYCRLHNIQ